METICHKSSEGVQNNTITQTFIEYSEEGGVVTEPWIHGTTSTAWEWGNDGMNMISGFYTGFIGGGEKFVGHCLGVMHEYEIFSNFLEGGGGIPGPPSV